MSGTNTARPPEARTVRTGQQNGGIRPRNRGERGCFGLPIGLARQAGRIGQFAPVWLDQRCMAVDREIAPLGIDDRGLAGSAGLIDDRANDAVIAQALGIVRNNQDIGPRGAFLYRRYHSVSTSTPIAAVDSASIRTI